eukprot:CAMPEP_0194264984 /NCGR_PEP_ID=MMETSP0169-20130528/345_1 /TAXON_ID=218684 /ORGANISM="Corethron pennatum, Strain L29A3" /LENGTH=55 /DNA_ID=CAMNT_0039005349 /DNA_START=66 /DNA_END=230 /DNA_ORIENTATION=+
MALIPEESDILNLASSTEASNIFDDDLNENEAMQLEAHLQAHDQLPSLEEVHNKS